jgi:hypothetical protein
MYRTRPLALTATALGDPSAADVAGMLVPPSPNVPVPATVLTWPVARFSERMVLLSRSAMNSSL